MERAGVEGVENNNNNNIGKNNIHTNSNTKNAKQPSLTNREIKSSSNKLKEIKLEISNSDEESRDNINLRNGNYNKIQPKKYFTSKHASEKQIVFNNINNQNGEYVSTEGANIHIMYNKLPNASNNALREAEEAKSTNNNSIIQLNRSSNESGKKYSEDENVCSDEKVLEEYNRESSVVHVGNNQISLENEKVDNLNVELSRRVLSPKKSNIEVLNLKQIIKKEIHPDNQKDESILEITYCVECLIDIPLRSKHCKECRKCVATFDHHCTWIGNCVGERNKRPFLLFLFTHSLELGLTVALVC